MLKEKDPNFSGTDTLEGLTAIVSIKHPDPQFESQTKVKLMNPEVAGAVSSVTADVLRRVPGNELAGCATDRGQVHDGHARP